MKRLIFKFSTFLCLISLFFVWVSPVKAIVVPSPNSSFYVMDQANLISTSTELDIIKTSEALYYETGAQIVLVTLNNLSGYDIEQYSVQLFRDWGIGNKEKNNGVLIILALEDREVRIEVGYGLEGAIPDSVAGRILDDYMLPNLQDGEYDVAFTETYNAVLSRVMAEYGLDSLTGVESNTSNENEVPWFWIIIGALILLSLDGYYLNGFILNLLLRTMLLASFGGSSGGSSFNRGGGGRTGGGGSSRRW